MQSYEYFCDSNKIFFIKENTSSLCCTLSIMLPLVHCSLMRGILLIVICGSSSLMPQGQKAIKGHCLLDYTRLMAAHLEAKAEAPELWLTAETQRSGHFTQHWHGWAFWASPCTQIKQPATCLRWTLRGTAAFLSTEYTFDSSIPFIGLRTSAALSMANPIILAGHKTVSFPMPFISKVQAYWYSCFLYMHLKWY